MGNPSQCWECGRRLTTRFGKAVYRLKPLPGMNGFVQVHVECLDDERAEEKRQENLERHREHARK